MQMGRPFSHPGFFGHPGERRGWQCRVGSRLRLGLGSVSHVRVQPPSLPLLRIGARSAFRITSGFFRLGSRPSQSSKSGSFRSSRVNGVVTLATGDFQVVLSGDCPVLPPPSRPSQTQQPQRVRPDWLIHHARARGHHMQARHRLRTLCRSHPIPAHPGRLSHQISLNGIAIERGMNAGVTAPESARLDGTTGRPLAGHSLAGPHGLNVHRPHGLCRDGPERASTR